MGKKSVRDSIIQDAQCECPTNKALFDKDKYLLNCINGTLNLKASPKKYGLVIYPK